MLPKALPKGVNWAFKLQHPAVKPFQKDTLKAAWSCNVDEIDNGTKRQEAKRAYNNKTWAASSSHAILMTSPYRQFWLFPELTYPLSSWGHKFDLSQMGDGWNNSKYFDISYIQFNILVHHQHLLVLILITDILIYKFVSFTGEDITDVY